MKIETKYRTIAFAFCIIIVLLAGLGVVQLSARQRFLLRGQTTDFPPPVADTELPPLCINAELTQYDTSELAWALDTIAAGGFAWVRQRFAWSDIEPAPGDFHWDAWDAVVAESVARDVRLIAVLDTAPMGLPPDPAAFANFASTIAARYGDTLTYYQIWHNPNLGESWAGQDGRADAYGYAELLAATARAIRAADSDARIILGSLAPNGELGARNYAEDIFLDMLYSVGAAEYFDVVAIQPYGFFAGPEERTVARETLNFSRAILVRETMVAHQDATKALWASHLGWNSKPAAWPGPDSIWGNVAAETQAAYTVAALTRVEREWPWLGLLCLNSFQPRPETVLQSVPNAEEHWGFAVITPAGATRPVYDAVQAWRARPAVARTGVHNASTPLANFEGAWTLGPLGADIGEHGASRVSLTFEGTGIALTVRRGPYRAFLYVTVDGEPAPALPRDRAGRSYVVLYDPLAATATVPLAENLPYGIHTVAIEAERGWNQWALADWRVIATPDIAILRWQMGGLGVLAGFGLVLGLALGRTLDWGRFGRYRAVFWERLHAIGQMTLGVTLSAFYLFATWHVMMSEQVFRRLGEGGTWATVALACGLYYFSPWMLLSIFAGLVVVILVVVRPSLGLALTMLAAPFYMHPLSLLGKSFALAELLMLPSLLGCLIHWFAHSDLTVNASLRISRFTFRVPRFTSRISRDTIFRWPLVAFVAVALLATVFASQRHEAVRELRLVVVEPLLFFAALVALPMSRRERWQVVDAFVAGAWVVAMAGLLQYGASFCRGVSVGELGNKKQEARNKKRVTGKLPISYFQTLLHSPRRLLYVLALPFIGLALLLSFSRGAIVLGIPAVLLFLGLSAGPKWQRATMITLFVGLLALIPLLRTPRFAGLLDFSSGTTSFRLSLWHSAWGMVREHPLLGVGLDNFLYAYRTRYVLPTAWEEFNLAHPHNVVLDFASRLGLLGLGVFIWLQAQFWRAAWPLRQHKVPLWRALVLGVMGSMVNFLAHGMVDASYFVIDLAYAFALALAVVVWLRNEL